MDDNKARFAKDTSARTLGDVIEGADVFLGLSAGNVLSREMVAKMAAKPLILALANPNPEIYPDDVKAVRDDAVMCTGRTDFPNQVNNVLCFPFIFRGALDVGATTITAEMEIAAVNAIAELAEAEQNEVVALAYGLSDVSFGPEYLIPKPFDPRLIAKVAPAVAKAAMLSGVATQPIEDFDAYRASLEQFVYHSGIIMRPIFAAAKVAPNKRIVLAEGEDERVLRAAQIIVDEGLARPILIGRPAVVQNRLERFGLRIRPGIDFELVNPEFDNRYRDYWQEYHRLGERKGITEHYAQVEMRRRATLIGAMMMRKGDADGMICGTFGNHALHLPYIDQVIGRRAGGREYGAMNALMLPGRQVFLVDTHVNLDPTAAQLCEITLMAAEELRRFGLVPKVALLSHSSFGSLNDPSAVKMRETLGLLKQQAPWMEVDGEMHGDAAVRKSMFPNSTLKGEANLLVFPNMESANISYNLLKTAAGGGVTIGPILLGAARSVHILTPSATVRRLVNMTALAVVDANPRPAGAAKPA
jgi:malate dehydrogenase (oxaloacetate-decarboxylating)(NADP+)